MKKSTPLTKKEKKGIHLTTTVPRKAMRLIVRCEQCNPNAHYATVVDEEGIVVTHHTSTDHDWVKHDLGITSPLKHELYNKKYPEGWKLINRIGM